MLVKKSSFLISGNDSLNGIDIVQRILLEHYQISIFSYLECARNTSLAVLVAFCAARRSLMRYQRSDGVPAVGPRSGLLASCDCHVVVFCHPLEKRV